MTIVLAGYYLVGRREGRPEVHAVTDFKAFDSLLPVLSHLRKELADVHADLARKHAATQQLAQLPHAVGAAYFAADSLLQQQVLITEIFEAKNHPSSGVQFLRSEYRDPMRYMVDLFLDATVRSQNAIQPYLSYTYAQSVPKSLRALIKNIETEKTSLPDQVSHLLLSYWCDHGSLVREYRDLSQHYSVVSTDARAYIDADKKVWLYVALPNNPRARRANDLRYSDPIVHALEYVTDELFALLAFIEALVALLIPSEVDTSQHLVMYNFTEPLAPAPNLGVRAPSSDSIISRWSQTHSLAAEAPAAQQAVEPDVE